MSRQIDPNRPYTDEEKEYLLTRSTGESLIQINNRRFSGITEDRAAELHQRAAADAELERREAAEMAEPADNDPDAYHFEDLDLVSSLTIQEIRLRLEKESLSSDVSDEDKEPFEAGDDPLDEKQVLGYRLLDHLDKVRKG